MSTVAVVLTILFTPVVVSAMVLTVCGAHAYRKARQPMPGQEDLGLHPSELIKGARKRCKVGWS